MPGERPSIAEQLGKLKSHNIKSNEVSQPETAFALSNSLTDLAARIRSEHEATSLALKRGVEHAITAGELLIEAKALVPHGKWLPWLAEHCALSERTAQLYMRVAKNRETIEKQNPQCVADLTMNEAAALLALTVGAKKLLDFARQLEDVASSEDLVSLCIAEGFEVIKDDSYNPFAGRSDAEIRDWKLFIWFLGGDEAAHSHTEWLLQRPFQSVDEWLGPEGNEFCASWRMRTVSAKTRAGWKKFRVEHAGMSEPDIAAKLALTGETPR